MVPEYRARMDRRVAPEQAVQALAMRLHGEIVRPGDPDYEDARGVWNDSVDRSPAMIVRCGGAVDVSTALTFAREHDLPLSVRSGGHSFAGHGTNDGGLVLDLSRMKGMTIDAASRVARIEPGLTWAEVAREAQRYGLALTSGDMGSVGVGGLTLGGGIGWMARKYGLTIDHLRAVELVSADGQFLRASDTENAELFWGLRGGGGNFGVATAFEFNMDPAGLILGGAVFYSAAHAADVLRAYAGYAAEAPDELTTMATLMYAPPVPFIAPSLHGTPVVAIMVCYAGDVEEGQRVVAPLRQLGTSIADVIGPMPYPAMFAMTEAGTIRGLQHHDRSMFLERLDDAIGTIVAQTATATSPMAMAQIRILGGAMSRVASDATAFAHRNKPVMFTIINSWPDPADSERERAWTQEFWRAMRPYASGVYVSFLEDEGEERIRQAYSPATYARLVALKNRYDPTNVFRLNQNIVPTTTPAQQGEHAERAA